MAVVKVTIPDDVLDIPTSPEQLVEDVRVAVLMFWVARGLIRADRVTAVLKGTRVDIQLERGPEKKLDLKEVLLAMPDVGDDSVFERVPDLGRKVPEWGS